MFRIELDRLVVVGYPTVVILPIPIRVSATPVEYGIVRVTADQAAASDNGLDVPRTIARRAVIRSGRYGCNAKRY
jgi:hypothetical protein